MSHFKVEKREAAFAEATFLSETRFSAQDLVALFPLH
jgi:hypothetical protein